MIARRIRAGLALGVIWAATWFVAGLVLARVPGLTSDVPFAILFAPLGFVTGIAFSALLVAVARRRSLDRMSVPRFAGWGAASGVLLSGLVLSITGLRGEVLGRGALAFGLAVTTASALCAAASLAVARRGETRQLRTEDLTAPDLTDAERRELLSEYTGERLRW